MGLCALVIVIGSSAAQAQPSTQQSENHVEKPLRAHDVSRRAQARAELARAARSLAALRRLPPRRAICRVFKQRFCGEALRVARCESRFRTDARNGQYRGLFQMGASERRRFGHGPSAIEQARAAHRYFVLAGRDWSPWSCKPWY